MHLGYVIIYVSDLEATIAFYERAFGIARRFVHESGYAEMETGATALAFASDALGKANAMSYRHNVMTDIAPGAEIAFTTDDVAAAYKRAVEAGAAAFKAPMQKPWGQTVAYVRDLNGFLVEICSPVGS